MYIGKKEILDQLKQGFLLYALATAVCIIQLLGFMNGSAIYNVMDIEGWVFFIASCISHASQIMLVPYIVFAILTAARLPRVAKVVQMILIVLLMALLQLDHQVYGLYRFHINGFVLSMVFGEGASQIFTFDTMLYVDKAIDLIYLIVFVWILSYTARNIYKKKGKAFVWPIALTFVGCTLYAHLWHIYASFKQHQSVVKSATLLPYYFPTTANGLMYDLGLVPPESYHNKADSRQSSDVKYPLNELQTEEPINKPNIVMIVIDSWNKRTLTKECMPNALKFAEENQWFTNHLSASNGTRSSIFGLFFGISAYYWESFEPSHIQPLLIDRLLELGYKCQTYPSATLLDPPFAKVIFGNVPNINVSVEGNDTYSRDSKITKMFIDDLKRRDKEKPFFSFLFFDLPHSFELTAEQNTRFKPAWDYADYTKLNNDLDPTPFWNLYRNCCYNDDLMLGQIFKAMEEEGLKDNTIVILTGDHSQEFNENRHNYWGHNSNFSVHQIGVPMICHIPWAKPQRFDHRTTHYDVVPTLLNQWLEVKNPIEDYSMGYSLLDHRPRKWHIVGSNLNYAFIIGGDTILEKKAEGSLDVYDKNMNLVTDFKMPVKEFDEAVKKLNRYFK